MEESAMQCRICFGDDDVDRMFSPCNCTGTMKNVHIRCLLDWVRAQPLNCKKCPVCGANYKDVDCRLNIFKSIKLSILYTFMYTCTCFALLFAYAAVLTLLYEDSIFENNLFVSSRHFDFVLTMYVCWWGANRTIYGFVSSIVSHFLFTHLFTFIVIVYGNWAVFWMAIGDSYKIYNIKSVKKD